MEPEPGTEDFTLFESGAMVQYLLARGAWSRSRAPRRMLCIFSGRGLPKQHALYLQWSWFAEATFARPLGEIVNHHRNFKPALPDVVQEMQGRALTCAAAVDAAVRGRQFIVGNTFTAADIMLGYTLMLCERLAPFDAYGDATRYWRGLSERPAAVTTFADLQQGPLGGTR